MNKEKLSKIISDLLFIESPIITDKSTLSDFSIDDLDVYEFLMFIEEDFKLDMANYFDMFDKGQYGELIKIPLINFLSN